MDPHKSSSRATIHDVARKAGVSAATVSKVLRGVATVRADNAERVREAVAALGYRMDPLASGLRGDNRRIIGTIVPDLESAFFSALVTELERLTDEAGFHMIIASSRESEEREADLVARMNDWRVSGTILAPVRSERGQGAAMLETFGMQAVLVDRVSANERFDTVSADNFAASSAVADFLIGAGHRHILIHGATEISNAVRTRVAGFESHAAVSDSGVRIDKLVADGTAEVQRASLAAYFDARSISELPSAIYSLSQHSTLVILAELRRRGIAIPGQVELVAFDDVEWMQTTWPSITAVAQPVTNIASAAMSILLGRIEGRAAGFPVGRLEKCNMVLRESAPGIRKSSSRAHGG